MNVSFPLRDNYFRPLEFTDDDERRWKQTVVDLVQLGLQEERQYYASQYQRIDASQWKLLREKDQLRVYRPRSSAPAAKGGSSGSSCVLAIGTIEGTLEDVIHGVHHVTTQDMRVTTSFLSSDALDSAVLHIFENGTGEDPYRNFAVKWRIIQTPAGGLVKNRDAVSLEYLGIDVDANGERYAFHITEAFDDPACPPFSPQCAIRAKAHIRIIYRQIRPGRVGVYFLGDYSLSGRIPDVVARISTAEIAISVGKSVECTEAKKLTTLALTTSPVLNKTMRMANRNPNTCTICRSSPGLLSTRTVSLCDLCGSPVCSKCRSRKHLLSDEKKIPVTCCKQCIVAAKNLTIDPRLPLRLVSAALWRSQNTISGDEHLWERECRSVDSVSSRSRGDSMSDGSLPGSMRSLQHSARTRSIDYSIDSDVTVLTSKSSASSIDLSYLDDHATTPSSALVLRPASKKFQRTPSSRPTTPAQEQAQMWMQMNELRIAAERTYQIAKQTNQLMVETEPTRVHSGRFTG